METTHIKDLLGDEIGIGHNKSERYVGLSLMTSTDAYWFNAIQCREVIDQIELRLKIVDPSYQTREELQTQLTELLNRANG